MQPPSPPMLDDILSQISQRDLSSTQLFRSNSEYFNNARKNKPYKAVDKLPSFGKQAFPFQSSFGSQKSKKEHGDWFSSGRSQPSQTQSRYLQSSLLTNEVDEADYGDEEFIQDSPELFTQRSDFYGHGAPHTSPDLEHQDDSEGMITHLNLSLLNYSRANN